MCVRVKIAVWIISSAIVLFDILTLHIRSYREITEMVSGSKQTLIINLDTETLDFDYTLERKRQTFPV